MSEQDVWRCVWIIPHLPDGEPGHCGEPTVDGLRCERHAAEYSSAMEFARIFGTTAGGNP